MDIIGLHCQVIMKHSEKRNPPNPVNPVSDMLLDRITGSTGCF